MSGKTQTVIEINGKRYDALSGRLLVPEQTKPETSRSGALSHIDGVHAKTKTAHRQVAAGHRPHKVERSQTLMRNAVKKPAPSVKHTDIGARPVVHPHVNAVRLDHALQVEKSPKISRFGSQAAALQTLTQVLHVKEPPHERSAHREAATASAPRHTSMFEAAIEHADAHTQPKLKTPSLRSRTAKRLKLSPRKLNLTVGSLAVLIIAGFIAYQNIPNVSLRIAATRAGVHASLPNYHPSGFNLRGPIQAQPGQITLTYHAVSDDRQFKVVQQATSWDNEALVEKFVASNNRPYQVMQANNKTIYIYDGGNATWVDNNIWYKIEGNSSLSSDQLLRIVSSM